MHIVHAAVYLVSDVEKGADAQTFSVEIFENCANFWIVEDNILIWWNNTL